MIVANNNNISYENSKPKFLPYCKIQFGDLDSALRPRSPPVLSLLARRVKTFSLKMIKKSLTIIFFFFTINCFATNTETFQLLSLD